MVSVIKFNTDNKELFLQARQIRDKVFVEEQQVNRAHEFDAHEDESTHYLLMLDGEPVGTARWRLNGDRIKLERFAVYHNHRNKGLGDLLLERVITDASKSEVEMYLHAQLKAIPFYERRGFKKRGEMFSECEIDHYQMVLEIV